MMSEEIKQQLLAEQTFFLERSIVKLDEIFQKIQLKQFLPFSEEECFEILTSRFARLSDLYTQKLLGLLFRILQEPDLNFIDKCRFLEKLGLIENSKVLYDIRSLRNQISHEYALEDLEEIQTLTLAKAPVLILIARHTLQYMIQMLKKIGE